ncbi:hypothetical protein [Streptomyces atratus]
MSRAPGAHGGEHRAERVDGGLVLGGEDGAGRGAEAAEHATSDHPAVSCSGWAGAVAGGRLEHAGQMDVKVLDFDLAAAVSESAGQKLRKSARAFPD